MKTINVTKPFKFTAPDGKTEDFEVGIQKVSDELADHWYVQEHSEPVVAQRQAKPSKDGDDKKS